MKSELLVLYKVTWKYTAATYVVARSYNTEEIRSSVRQCDDRCDDIVDVEKVFLPAFEGDTLRNTDYVHLFLRSPIAL